MSYNGWKNYETWCVALWIDQDPSTYDERIEMGRRHLKDADDDKQEAANTLAGSLKCWVEMELLPDLAGLAGDLIGSALSEVDWYEIAENFLADEEE